MFRTHVQELQMNLQISSTSSTVNSTISRHPFFKLFISSTIPIFQSSPSGISLYWFSLMSISANFDTLYSRQSFRIFRPVVERQSFSISCRTRRSTCFLLSLILLMKLMKRFFNDFTICIVSDKGSKKNLCVVLGRFSMILWDTFHDFSNLM